MRQVVPIRPAQATQLMALNAKVREAQAIFQATLDYALAGEVTGSVKVLEINDAGSITVEVPDAPKEN